MEPRQRRAREIEKWAKVLLGGGVEGVVQKMMSYFDDLDAAMDFFIRSKRSPLLGLAPGGRTDRWGIAVRLQERIEADPALRDELLRHPRHLIALAFQEANGIRVVDFLSQVESVEIVEEEPGLHWLIVPECHHGCEVAPHPSPRGEGDSCQVCGNPQGPCPRRQATAADDRERIRAVDDLVVRMANADPATRARLTSDPTAVFTEAALALFGHRPQEDLGVHEVKVARDSETSIVVPLLARHESKKQAAAVATA